MHVVADRIQLQAGTAWRLACGDSALELTPEQLTLSSKTLTLRADTLTIQSPDEDKAKSSVCLTDGAIVWSVSPTVIATADGGITAGAKTAALVLGNDGTVHLSASEARIQGSASTLSLAGDAKLEGSSVNLYASPSESAQVSATPEDQRTSFVDLELLDDQGNAVPNASFWLEMSNGESVHGKLDESGTARVRIVPGTCEVSFPLFDQHAWVKGGVTPAVTAESSEGATAAVPDAAPIYGPDELFYGYDETLGTALAEGIITMLKDGWTATGKRQLRPFPARLTYASGICAQGVGNTVAKVLDCSIPYNPKTKHRNGQDWAWIGTQFSRFKKLDIASIESAGKWDELPLGCLLSWTDSSGQYGHVALVTAVPADFKKGAPDVEFDAKGKRVAASDHIYVHGILFSSWKKPVSVEREASSYGALLAVFMPWKQLG